MPLNQMPEFTFKHANQIDPLYTQYTGPQIKSMFDSRGDELRTALNNLITALNTSTGASNISATAPSGLTGATIQDLINSLLSYVQTNYYNKTDFQSLTQGSSGGSKINVPQLTPASGTTVEAQLAYLLQQIGNTALGSIPDGSVTLLKMASDVINKMNSPLNQIGAVTDVNGNITNLNTSDKTNIVNGINSHLADYSTDIGVANAYKINLIPAPISYEIGKIYKFKATNTNTGACTFQINSLSAIPIKKNVSSDLVSGDIIAGQIVPVVYDGTNMQMIGVLGITSAEKANFNSHLNALVTDASGVHGLKIETGVFTPTFTDGTNQPTSYAIQYGNYHKIGNRVFFDLYVVIGTKGTSIVGNIFIGGLPFVSKNTVGMYCNASVGEFTKILRGTQMLTGYVAPNSTLINLKLNGDNASPVFLNAGNIVDGSAVQISGNYLIN